MNSCLDPKPAPDDRQVLTAAEFVRAVAAVVGEVTQLGAVHTPFVGAAELPVAAVAVSGGAARPVTHSAEEKRAGKRREERGGGGSRRQERTDTPSGTGTDRGVVRGGAANAEGRHFPGEEISKHFKRQDSLQK